MTGQFLHHRFSAQHRWLWSNGLHLKRHSASCPVIALKFLAEIGRLAPFRFKWTAKVTAIGPLPLIRILAVFGLLLTCPAFVESQDVAELPAQTATAEICRTLQHSTVRIVSNNDRSSGVIVSEAGHILTVAHGLHGDSTKAVIVFHDGSKAAAEIILRDKTLDVAVLKLSDEAGRQKLIPNSIAPPGLSGARIRWIATGDSPR